MEELPINTALKIYKALDSLNSGTGHTMEVMKNDAFSVFMYKEIMNFSSDELINLKNIHNRPISFFNLAMTKRNPLVFTALIKKRVGLDQLEPHCKWLVETFPDMPLGIYEVIYNDQHQKPSTNDNYNSTPENRISYFFDNLFRYLEKNTNSYNNNVIGQLYEKFQDTMHVEFLKAIVSNVTSFPNTTATLVSKIKEVGNDLNKDSCISLLLPKETNNMGQPNLKFQMTTKQLDSLERLFILGFSPHNDYLWHGENLLTSLMNSGEKEQIERVLPYLLISMENNNIEEDKKLIESLSDKPTYTTIRAIYFKALFENFIPNKNEDVPKKKLKI